MKDNVDCTTTDGVRCVNEQLDYWESRSRDFPWKGRYRLSNNKYWWTLWRWKTEYKNRRKSLEGIRFPVKGDQRRRISVPEGKGAKSHWFLTFKVSNPYRGILVRRDEFHLALRDRRKGIRKSRDNYLKKRLFTLWVRGNEDSHFFQRWVDTREVGGVPLTQDRRTRVRY